MNKPTLLFRVLASSLLVVVALTVLIVGPGSTFANDPVSPITPITPPDNTTPTPTPTPDPSDDNHKPKFVSVVLGFGKVGKPFSGKLQASDRDKDDMTMEITDLPSGLSMGDCTTQLKHNRSVLTCEVEGTPSQAGFRRVRATVTDEHGAQNTRTFILYIKPAGWWW